MDTRTGLIPPKIARALGTKRGRAVAAMLAVAAAAAIVYASGAFSARRRAYAWPVTHLRAPGAANSSAIVDGSTIAAACVPGRPSFFETADSFATDKTQHAPHHYEFAYQTLVAPRRCTAASMLEIGLGCGMGYGPGHSVPLWMRYLPVASISVFEFDYPCLVDFLAHDPIVRALVPNDVARLHLFSGDQSDPEALLRAVATTGPYDIIVDDGGHTMMQQIVSLSVLLQHVKPGGVYVLEDLATSFEPAVADLSVSTVDFIARIMACLHSAPLRERIDAQHSDLPVPHIPDDRVANVCDLARLVESISCWEEVCIFTRWAQGAEPPPWRGLKH